VMECQRPHAVFFRRTVERLANPIRPMEVAHAAGRIFQIRLELKYRVAETLVSTALRAEQPFQKRIAMTSQESRQHFLLELGAGGFIAGEKAIVEKRGIRLDVRRIKRLEVRADADLMPDAERQIPQGI